MIFIESKDANLIEGDTFLIVDHDGSVKLAIKKKVDAEIFGYQDDDYRRFKYISAKSLVCKVEVLK